MIAKLTIDKSGRIVLPKPVRVRHGLKAQSKLELTERSGELILKPVAQGPTLRRKGKFLIHVGTAPPDFDVVAAIKEDRDDRIRHLLGRR